MYVHFVTEELRAAISPRRIVRFDAALTVVVQEIVAKIRFLVERNESFLYNMFITKGTRVVVVVRCLQYVFAIEVILNELTKLWLFNSESLRFPLVDRSLLLNVDDFLL